jgi:hypothetical protein
MAEPCPRAPPWRYPARRGGAQVSRRAKTAPSQGCTLRVSGSSKNPRTAGLSARCAGEDMGNASSGARGGGERLDGERTNGPVCFGQLVPDRPSLHDLHRVRLPTQYRSHHNHRRQQALTPSSLVPGALALRAPRHVHRIRADPDSRQNRLPRRRKGDTRHDMADSGTGKRHPSATPDAPARHHPRRHPQVLGHVVRSHRPGRLGHGLRHHGERSSHLTGAAALPQAAAAPAGPGRPRPRRRTRRRHRAWPGSPRRRPGPH